ncbi:hypothetical protein AAVH_09048 [Aphelenchoides avenae]|nr:hypothetical protein AAVH_09048 [Aphelenchus avenae]
MENAGIVPQIECPYGCTYTSEFLDNVWTHIQAFHRDAGWTLDMAMKCDAATSDMRLEDVLAKLTVDEGRIPV